MVRELKKLCKMNLELIPTVMRSLGTPTGQIKKCLGRTETKTADLQKNAIIFSARILQKVLEM